MGAPYKNIDESTKKGEQNKKFRENWDLAFGNTKKDIAEEKQVHSLLLTKKVSPDYVPEPGDC